MLAQCQGNLEFPKLVIRSIKFYHVAQRLSIRHTEVFQIDLRKKDWEIWRQTCEGEFRYEDIFSNYLPICNCAHNLLELEIRKAISFCIEVPTGIHITTMYYVHTVYM